MISENKNSDFHYLKKEGFYKVNSGKKLGIQIEK